VPIDRNTGDRQSSSLVRTETPQRNTNFYQMIIGLLLFGMTGLLGYLIWDKFSTSDRMAAQLQSFPASGTLTVGYVNRTPSRPQAQKRDYPQFKSYLETELRKKYGNAVKVELEPVLTTRAAQNQIKHKKWDLVFTASATNSLVAEDVQYEFIARMSATEDPYRDVCFFVKQDSPINSSKDFTPERTIALPSDDSPIFTMPLYDLYGKRMRISMGNTLAKIQEKVKAGEADVGVDFCKTIAQSPEFRTLSPNRIIPVGGVFLSPNITNIADRDYIKDAISKAPEDIQLKANYTRSSGVNYTQFRRINDRANQLLNCVDFTRNPVDFYCNNQPQKDKDKDTAPLF
jgi:ABC-type phosphate/phosphonate transport system substrate-binding protein